MRFWLVLMLAAAMPAAAADNAVERGMQKAGKAIERGAKATGRALDNAGNTVAGSVGKAHKKVDDKVRPKK
jgi:hypothetical protein